MGQQFDPQIIEAALHQKGIDWIQKPEYFASIASSNDYLMGLPGSLHGRVCLCDYQTQGKGRCGKQWFSSADTNLMFSLGWEPYGPLSSEISLLVGVALADALVQAGVQGVALKWPNDVLVEGRKLAGILIESRVRGERVEMVFGIGLNVRHQAGDLQAVEQPWTDLAALGLAGMDRQQCLIDILSGLARRLAQMQREGFAPIREDWLAYHGCQGMEMTYQQQGQRRVGRVVGLDHAGALLLETDGQRVAVNSGEVNDLRAES